MPKYLFKSSYTADGVRGLLKEGGTTRRVAVEKLITTWGGSVESFYYAFGDHDLYIIADLADHATAAAIALTVTATGTGEVSTTVLLTSAEVDAAAKKTPTFRAPGR